jgi:hypothetical protein
MDICESNISHFNYSHTCITRSDLGQRKSGLNHPVLNTFSQAPEFADPVRYNFSILFNDQPVISKLLRMTRWCNG